MKYALTRKLLFLMPLFYCQIEYGMDPLASEISVTSAASARAGVVRGQSFTEMLVEAANFLDRDRRNPLQEMNSLLRKLTSIGYYDVKTRWEQDEEIRSRGNTFLRNIVLSFVFQSEILAPARAYVVEWIGSRIGGNECKDPEDRF